MIVFLFIGLCFAHTIPRSVSPPAEGGGRGAQNCNATDRIIYTKRGHTFAKVFRSFGGFSVSKSAYAKAIVDFMHLSPTCAECYSDAYICGWNNCKMKCAMAGPRCDKCLEKAGCIDACNKCTKFY